MHRLRIALLFLTTAFLPGVVGREACAQRYWALLSDGSTLTGDTLPHWDSAARDVSFGGRMLFDPQNPVRVLCDTAAVPERSVPYVMMANGDIVLGTVVGYSEAESGMGLPAVLQIRLQGSLAAGENSRLSVRADRVMRIVAVEPAPVEGLEARLLLRTGQKLRYRALRWRAEGPSLLTDSDRIDVSWSEIADLQIANMPRFLAVRESVAFPGLDPSSLIGRVKTQDGAVLTYPRQLLRDGWADHGQGKRVYVQLVQPAWTDAPIPVPFNSICFRTYWANNELPLSLLEITANPSAGGIYPMPWRRNCNVLNGMLRVADVRSDLGLGMHAPSVLEISLPPHAQSFCCQVGLDRAARNRGCAKCLIRQNSANGPVLWESGVLRGGGKAQRVGPVPLNGAERLVLQAEMAHRGRPVGADPLDICDHVDWLLPFIEVLPAAGERMQLATRKLPGWESWVRVDPPDEELRFDAPMWHSAREVWAPRISASNGALVFHRRLIANGEQNCVNLLVGPEKRIPSQNLELRVNGESRPAIFHSLSKDQVRYLWEFIDLEQHPVEVELSVKLSSETGSLCWLGCGIGAADRYLQGLPHTERTAELWRRLEARLADDPPRLHELRKGLLQTAGYDQRVLWMSEFFAAEQERGTPQAIATVETLIAECELPEETLAAFRSRVVHSFLQHWLLLGPFSFDGGRAFDQPLSPERDGVDLTKSYPGAKGPVRWHLYRSPERRVSMGKAFLYSLDDCGVAYAVCWIRCDKTRRVKLGLGADDRIKVWINRQLVFADHENHGASPRQFTAQLDLRDGWNELLIKLDSHYGEWEFYCEVLDPALDRLPDDLQVRTTPPGGPDRKPAP